MGIFSDATANLLDGINSITVAPVESSSSPGPIRSR